MDGRADTGPRPSSDRRGERQKILIVEDDVVLRGLMIQTAHQAGFEAKAAETGEQALLILRKWPRRIDWLFTRTALPGLVDGWILADEFHQTHPGRPVLLSGWLGSRQPPTGTIVLERPASPFQVAETLRGLVESRPADGIGAMAA
jgi:CheY-like chemotaxis protein